MTRLEAFRRLCALCGMIDNARNSGEERCNVTLVLGPDTALQTADALERAMTLLVPDEEEEDE